ncbi:S-adenosyl-L-methionine-dependent methyltransferase [Mycena maculata]|uniref:S-adenosyl-L-methionine-dependent methyltransferase n=1 Tax=Mycena maculata TaxID=230809 RepID=A0AAD7MJ88_9AGAR|nr:S-adenosyl-L-methionine-dependent methyltransferase [Mycena maculata]
MSAKAQIEALLALINNAAHQAIAEYDKAGKEVPTLDSVEPHPLDISDDTSGLKKAIRLLEGACEQLCVTLAPPSHTITKRTQNCDWPCIMAVIEARVPDILAGHPGGLHVDELSKKIDIDAGKLSRILRFLAARHCFTEVDADVFSNNRLSLMLHSANPIRDLAYIQLNSNIQASTVLWENLTTQPYTRSHELHDAPLMQALQFKGSYYEWIESQPEKRPTFQRAMVGFGQVAGSRCVFYDYNWDGCKTLCDLGSGVGNFSMPLARLHPEIHVSMLDLPGPMAQARALWAQEYPTAIEEKRVEFIEGDFLRPLSVKDQDIYYVPNCLHNWSDDAALVILENICQAMGSHSRLLVHDSIIRPLTRTPGKRVDIDEAPGPLLPNFGIGSARSHNLDITMLLAFNTSERTLDELKNLATKAGLVMEGVLDMVEMCMLEFRVAA